MSAEAPPRRLDGLDAAKGLAIVGVVLIHAGRGHSPLYGEHVLNGLARLAVPCFLVISGYLVALKASPPRRLRDHLLVFLRLHLVWAALHWLLHMAFHGLPATLDLKDVVVRFGEGAYPGQFYFVILIQTYLLAWLLPRRLWASPSGLGLAAAAVVAGVLFLHWLIAHGIRRPDGLPTLMAIRALTSSNAVWLWFYFFALGGLLGDRARRGLRPSARSGLLWAGAGVAVATLARPDWPQWAITPGLPYLKLPVYAGATLIALALPALAARSAPRLLTGLGAESFAIFVLNPALLAVLAHALGRADSVAMAWLYASVTLAIAWALARPLRRWAPFTLP